MQAKRPKLLGIATSLRNARWGIGNQKLVDSLKKIPDKKGLFSFLEEESDLHLENFLEAGRREGKTFLEIYKNLKKKTGHKGLSNSETALAAALWAGYQSGVDIDHLSLSEYFPASGRKVKVEELKEKLISADGILVSGPVYFGDRSSLAQELMDMIRTDPALAKRMKGKIYGGITVGAKRNGGQETTLIYQLLDAISLGMLGVGNDSETTAQYGGTGHAGDVGTMHHDHYGLTTSIGTGHRVAELIKGLGGNRELQDPVRVLFLVLKDSNGTARRMVEDLIEPFNDRISPTIIEISNKNIQRCIACDICPTEIDVDEVYRCIIKSDSDDFEALHGKLLGHDAIVPVVASMKDTSSVKSNYQTFIERSRYLRRGDYVFSNTLVAPLIIEEVGAQTFYQIRLVTSFIRHHTVITNPMTAHIHDNKLLNKDQLFLQFEEFITASTRLAAARLADSLGETVKYNPVGYVLSANKNIEDERLKKRISMIKHRAERLACDAEKRLKSQTEEEQT